MVVAFKEDVVLDLPVEAQMTVVNNMVLPLLKRAGIDVRVGYSPGGMSLVLTFTEPKAAADGADDPGKSFGTDAPDKAQALWDLKSRVEAARGAHSAQHAGGFIDAEVVDA